MFVISLQDHVPECEQHDIWEERALLGKEWGPGQCR